MKRISFLKIVFLSFLVCFYGVAKPSELDLYSTQLEKTAKLKYSVDFVLDFVLKKKNLVRNPLLEMPQVFLQSQTDLELFQISMFEQWGMQPDQITNAYSVKTNRIFLNDDKTYYDRLKRCMDDSLAHELAHYVQVVYQKWDLNDDSLEWDAVDIQTQFREEFCPTHENSRVSTSRH